MKTKPDFKFGDQVVFIGDRQKRGVVSRVFRSGGLWWLAFEGKPDWRYEPRYFKLHTRCSEDVGGRREL
jgi:hypothetical protein